MGKAGEIPVYPFSRNEPPRLVNASKLLKKREILCRFTGHHPETNGRWLLLIVTVIKNCFPLKRKVTVIKNCFPLIKRKVTVCLRTCGHCGSVPKRLRGRS